MLNITLTDERKNKTLPLDGHLTIETIKPVAEFAHFDTSSKPLTIEVFLNDNTPDKHFTTEAAHPVKGENGEVDMDHWHIHLLIVPKDELTYGSQRAISRALSREMFLISAMRTYGPDLVKAMYSPEDFSNAATKFADDAPWAVA